MIKNRSPWLVCVLVSISNVWVKCDYATHNDECKSILKKGGIKFP